MALSKLSYIAVGLVSFLPALAGAARADHLLISQVLVSPAGTQTDEASSEYIEVFNPTSSPVSLKDYYLTDYKEYYTLPAGSFAYGDRSDFMLRFPDNITLAPGATIVVTQSASQFVADLGSKFGGSVASFSAQMGGPQLLEVKDTNATVGQMINLKAGELKPNTLGLNDTGGFVTLFYWDGATDLVKDVDIVRFGTAPLSDALVMKTGLSVDGPDADATASTYLTDAGLNAFNYTGSVTALKRVSADEATELSANGNGITGHDETSENLHASFASVTAASLKPGLPNVSLYPSSVDDWQVY
jgi:hypothetical protein